ncbi:hypothetical protein BOTBODRAFT_286502 [Botryobasidium botryosum FD-172 SS1]|uniref:RlpA-like protein double-psi beta-barrel domain-containing protein n=1 Tax=Botryobasidium botryosum (strain FD-172 SS1) TaxID=930990 RepID=A0A067MIY0_BOTB1|nr:hypothetical protein BOTBODRAFT_286502 [Botryobasidium botryosum FD-172 SS1]
MWEERPLRAPYLIIDRKSQPDRSDLFDSHKYGPVFGLSTVSTFVTAAAVPPSPPSPPVNHTGDASYFDLGDPSVGACGQSYASTDFAAATSATIFNADPSICGRTINISFQNKTATATVVDSCDTSDCGDNDLILTAAVFEELAPLSVGILQGVQWTFA